LFYPFIFKKYLKIPANQGFSVIILDRFFELLIFTLIFISALFYLISTGPFLPTPILSTIPWMLACFVLLIFIVALALFFKKTVRKIFRIFNFLKKHSFAKNLLNSVDKKLQFFHEGLFLFKNKKIYKFLIPLTLISWFLELLACYLIFNSVFFISFLDIAAAQIIGIGISIISFIPGGIGITEIGIVYILKLRNYPVALSASGILLARFILTGILLVSGIIGTFLIKEKGK